MTTTTFPPLTKGFTWVNSTTGAGQPLPPGETQTGATVGVRADGDTAHAAGNYKYLITTSGSASQLLITDSAWIAAKIPPGNYWAAVDQTDALNGQSATSLWTSEQPFSIPQPVVQPDSPTGFIAA